MLEFLHKKRVKMRQKNICLEHQINASQKKVIQLLVVMVETFRMSGPKEQQYVINRPNVAGAFLQAQTPQPTFPERHIWSCI